jgi:NADH-quinone oxidoreductase subunit M
MNTLRLDGVPATVFALSLLPLWLPVLLGEATTRAARASVTLGVTIALALASFAVGGPVAFSALAVGLTLQAFGAGTDSRLIRSTLLASATCTVTTALALAFAWPVIAFVASVLAVTLRVGVMPLHAGAVALGDRSPAAQTQQLGATLVLVLAHLRFTDHIAFAYDVAPFLVVLGAVATLVPGLIALVQPDLRGFYRTATAMHGGMILASLGAAGRGHEAAALMVVLTTAFAVGGLGLLIVALEARVGPVRFDRRGGRVQAFPRLAAGFALFAAAGVAMPGTSGFIADDLMLHALWGESVTATVMIIVGAAALAVASLRAYSATFLGPAVASVAPDLNGRERAATTVLVVALLILGIVPGLLLTPADVFLNLSDAP